MINRPFVAKLRSIRPRYLILLMALLLLGRAGSLSLLARENPDLTQYETGVPQEYFRNLPFGMQKVGVPKFPEYSVSISDFGAIPDGETINSGAFVKAIADVSKKGGGTVTVPRGIWLTGPIALKSNINLYLQQGAFIRFSNNFDLYPLIETSYEGQTSYRCVSPITIANAENVAITGKGIIDGSGGAWRPVKKFKMTDDQWEALLQSGGVLNQDDDIWYPTEKALQGSRTSPDQLKTKQDYEAIKDFLRPVMISIRESRNVLLDGPTFQNSPAWNIHPLMSENLVIRNITVRNPWFSQNGDGLDLESCKNAVVYNNSFDVGDDAICLKSGKNEAGRKRGMPTENVIIRDNTVYHAHGGFVVGSEMSGGIKNIQVANLTFIGTDVGIRFKSTRGRGGTVENIFISDINMTDINTEPIRFNLFYGGQAPTPGQSDDSESMQKREMPPVTMETPRFQDIHIKNIICRSAGAAMWIQGLPEMNIQNMTLENIQITSTKGASIMDVDNLTMKNVDITVNSAPVLFLYNGTDVQLDGLNLTYQDSVQLDAGIQVAGSATDGISLNQVSLHNIKQIYSLEEGVNRSAIVQH